MYTKEHRSLDHVAMNTPIATDFDLILIGKTGNGKSATGNAILRRPEFNSCYNTTSITKYPQYGVTRFENKVIQVVDCPGLLDTDIDQTGGEELVKRALQNAILANPQGYHAFLIVIKFGNRFTREEQHCIEILKQILGENVLKIHGVVVLCNGDLFEYFEKNEGLDKKKCINEISGPMKELFNECNNRIVIFNNITTDKETQHKQLKDLIDVVNTIKNDGQCFTNEDFKNAELIYKNIIQSEVDKKMLIAQSLILQDIKDIEKLPHNDEKMRALDVLSNSCMKLIESIKKKDTEKGLLKKMLAHVTETINYIQNMKKLLSNCNSDSKNVTGNTCKGSKNNTNSDGQHQPIDSGVHKENHFSKESKIFNGNDNKTESIDSSTCIQSKKFRATETEETKIEQINCIENCKTDNKIVENIESTSSDQMISAPQSEALELDENTMKKQLENLEKAFNKIQSEAQPNVIEKCLNYLTQQYGKLLFELRGRIWSRICGFGHKCFIRLGSLITGDLSNDGV